MNENITRRQFVAAAAVGALSLTAAGGCAPRSRRGSARHVETPSSSFEGASPSAMRALVCYATRTGSTPGVAEEVAKTLAKRGITVDVRPFRERPVVDGYDAVVLGSAVNGGTWLPEALTYVKDNRTALSAMPVAAFCVHIMNLGDDGQSRERRVAYLDEVRAAVKLTDEGYFAGVGPTADDASPITLWAFRTFGGAGEGDCRDWNAIRSWARSARVEKG